VVLEAQSNAGKDGTDHLDGVPTSGGRRAVTGDVALEILVQVGEGESPVSRVQEQRQQRPGETRRLHAAV
jgi:hypothetical protein